MKTQKATEAKEKSWKEPIVNLYNANVDRRRVSSRRVTFKNTQHFHLSPPLPFPRASLKRHCVTYASDRADWRGNRARALTSVKSAPVSWERYVRSFDYPIVSQSSSGGRASRPRRINKSVREDTWTHVDSHALEHPLSLRTGHVVLPKKSRRDSRPFATVRDRAILPPSLPAYSLFLPWTTVRDSVASMMIRTARTLPQLAAATWAAKWSDVREFGRWAEVRAVQGKQRCRDRDTDRAARDVGDEIEL